MEKIIMNTGVLNRFKMLRLSIETCATIVCSDHHLARELISLAFEEYGANIPSPITYQDFREIVSLELRTGFKGDFKGFLIDDLDRLLEAICTVPIKAITMSLDD